MLSESMRTSANNTFVSRPNAPAQQQMCSDSGGGSQNGEAPLPQVLRSQDDLVALLKQRRTDAGLTQTQLATQLGIGQSRLGNWEAGSSGIPFDQLIRILDRCGLELVARPRDALDAGEVGALLAGLPPAELQQVGAVAMLLRDGDPAMRTLAQRILGALATSEPVARFG